MKPPTYPVSETASSRLKGVVSFKRHRLVYGGVSLIRPKEFHLASSKSTNFIVTAILPK